jgi:hypothetical protein
MTFRVEITRTAAREIEERYERIKDQGRNSAEKWRAGLIEAIEALETNPDMYPEAGSRVVWQGTARVLLREEAEYLSHPIRGSRHFRVHPPCATWSAGFAAARRTVNRLDDLAID